MKISYSPQFHNEDIEYSFEGEAITATYRGVEDTFDFSEFGDGILPLGMDDENGELITTVDTTLDICPILHAERKNGELFVKLLYFYDDEMGFDDRLIEYREVGV